MIKNSKRSQISHLKRHSIYMAYICNELETAEEKIMQFSSLSEWRRLVLFVSYADSNALLK